MQHHLQCLFELWLHCHLVIRSLKPSLKSSNFNDGFFGLIFASKNYEVLKSSISTYVRTGVLYFQCSVYSQSGCGMLHPVRAPRTTATGTADSGQRTADSGQRTADNLFLFVIHVPAIKQQSLLSAPDGIDSEMTICCDNE
jgi:hypothetical protein